ncbi:hypothetical protein [Anaerovibrio sp.]|uniref:hypothetical protein n=1 Tax=Anaerovibrio sp. TaxID=1872532 RepID=UPI0025B95A8C|nr:hypothetical protein [Anaerovibrio sp.]MBR2142080.1 hypothetical protein [Anaerovibrio sp.]
MEIMLTPFSLFVELIHMIIDEFYVLTMAIGIPSYGIAFILMAICVRLLMYPLKKKKAKYNTVWKRTKALNEERKMQMQLINQERKDELEKIKEVYKKYPQFVHRKTNELYRKYGVVEECNYKYDGCL